MIWVFIIIIENIIKSLQYAWFILVPVILIVIFLTIKKQRINKKNITEIKKISKIIYGLILVVFFAIFTVRTWGPNFYKIIIGFSICGKEKTVEQKLEKKYGRNFNYISRSKIVVEKDAASTLGQNINGDYYVKYIFKDDDGVIAIVEYKKNYQCDYYESKRSKYEIEKTVYDYAKTVNFDKNFYVYVESPSELIDNSNLNDKARDNFILEERNHSNIIFILTDQSDKNQDFIVSALKTIFDSDNYVYVYEHVVTEDEYERAVSFYNSISSQNGIAEYDYEEQFDFNKNSEVHIKSYHIR